MMTEMKVSQQAQAVTARPFGAADKIGYALGDMGNNFTLNLVNSFLMIFYTNIFGLNGAVVAGLFFAARLIDAFVDITAGRLVDMSPLRPKGRFTPWVIRMKYPLAIAAILLFVPLLSQAPMWGRIVYAFVTYLAFGIFYSFVNIPYGSMASAISSDPLDKTSLSTWRSIGAAVGSAIVSYVVPIVMYSGTSDQINGTRFFVVATILALLGTLAYIGTTSLTTERVRIEKKEPVPLKTMFQNMGHDKALVFLVIVDIVVVINQNLSGITLTYLFNDYFKNKHAMSIALVFNFTTVIIVAPFAQFLVRRFGRKESATVALLLGGAIYGVLWLLHTPNTGTFLVGLFFGSLGAGVFNLMVWAFITDAIDNEEVTTGVREDGVIYGVNSFARKLAQAIAGGFGGLMLSIIGYRSSTKGGAAQTPEVINRIYDLAVGIPTVCLLLAGLLLLFFYPLTKDRVQGNAKELQIRHLEEIQESSQNG